MPRRTRQISRSDIYHIMFPANELKVRQLFVTFTVEAE